MERASNLASLHLQFVPRKFGFKRRKEGEHRAELQNKMNFWGYLDFHFRCRGPYWYMGCPVEEIAIPFHVVQIWRRCINMNHSLSIVPGFAYSMSPAPTMIERTITLADEDAHSEQQQPFYRAYGQVVGGSSEYLDFGMWLNKIIVI